jgi:hypothetical protein
MKMGLDMATNSQLVLVSFELLVNVDVLITLSYILPLLEIVHNFINFFQINDIFVDLILVLWWNFVKLYMLFVVLTTKF